MSIQSRRNFLKMVTLGGSSWALSDLLISKRTQGTRIKPNDFLRAVKSGNLEQAKSLLRQDPQLIKSNDAAGRSAYTVAMLAGHPAIGAWLVSSGHQPDLHEVVLGLDWNQLETTAKNIGDAVSDRINQNHPVGGTAMFAAAAGGAGTSIWRVYAQGGDPNRHYADNLTTPLQQALRFRDLQTAELTAFTLLANSADPNAHLPGDLPPLLIAAERGSHEITEMLIRLGANVMATDRQNRTAAQIADTRGQKKISRLLASQENIPRTFNEMRASTDINENAYLAPEWSRLSLLTRSRFVGAAHSQLANVKKQLKKDKRLAHSVATTGERAVEAGAHMGNKSIVSVLLDHGAPYSLPTAVMMNDKQTVKQYVKKNPKRIHERGAHDFALLWYPIIGDCDLDMLQLLLDNGAEVEQQSQMGTTALHWACLRGANTDVVKLLIESGANVNRVGRKFGGRSQTPLQLARDTKVIKLLKSAGAK